MENEIDIQHRSCPLNGQICSDGIRSDFKEHPITGQKFKCRWWAHMVGKDPQTEKSVDRFDCSISWLPIIGIENAQAQRFTAASVDKVANEVRRTTEVPINIISYEKDLKILQLEKE